MEERKVVSFKDFRMKNSSKYSRDDMEKMYIELLNKALELNVRTIAEAMFEYGKYNQKYRYKRYRERNKARYRKWYDTHKEDVAAYKKRWYEANKERILAQQKAHRRELKRQKELMKNEKDD